MADDTIQPTVDEPTATPQEGTDEVANLLAELKTMGVESPEDLQGMARASSEAGRLANMVGELRTEIAELKAQPIAPAPVPQNEYGEPSVDLGALVEQGVEKVLNKRMQAQAKASQQVMRELAEIKNDPDYPAVKEIWEKHTQRPDVQMKYNSGQTTISAEYDKVVRSTYRNLLKRSQGVIETFGQNPPVNVNPPHIETGQVAPPLAPGEEDEKQERIKKITKNRNGSDAELEALINAVLPGGDPILQI